ncbi:MAG: ATP-binding protein [Candidatus Aminicenantes bacterium]|nr:ATP-binding protein [Candidatus Aminicenantes bacterium]
MIKRTLATRLRKAADQFPIVTVTGPRQSGKTTLVKAVFKDYAYLSLELPDQRRYALEDPRGFLAQFDGPVILDEVQRAPDLFSYIQVSVDERPEQTGRFILTGSQNFLLMQSITQSLAGRCAVLHLLPLSMAELMNRESLRLETLGRDTPGKPVKASPPKFNLEEMLYSGFYPRIHDKGLSAHDWLPDYFQTYIERDVRNILNVGDIEAFGRFIRLCAGRSGQLLNLSGLASDCGISHPTARRWLSVLEASFVITLLRPHHKNFGKRLTKSPKLYFLDTGLLCYLLQIGSARDLGHRAERGAVFESYVVAELTKNFVHRGIMPGISFWRDSAGHEVDIIVDLGSRLIPIEVKSAQTVASDFFDMLIYWSRLAGVTSAMDTAAGPAALVYGGDHSFKRSGITVLPWFAL